MFYTTDDVNLLRVCVLVVVVVVVVEEEGKCVHSVTDDEYVCLSPQSTFVHFNNRVKPV